MSNDLLTMADILQQFSDRLGKSAAERVLSVRKEIIGSEQSIETPYGKKKMLYTDYTASGRSLRFLNQEIEKILQMYANTHTEDTTTGRYMTSLLHEAYQVIASCLHADLDAYVVFVCGTGATGAIKRLQEILGVYIPSFSFKRLEAGLDMSFEQVKDAAFAKKKLPIVLVGPYEHHSNEVTWRLGFCKVGEIGLDSQGQIDLMDLEKQLDRYKAHDNIFVSLSACSNVTGVKSNIPDIVKLCKIYRAKIFFDFAALAPYVPIDLSDGDIDGLFFSPHKFIGGDSTTGILVIKRDLYKFELPPTHGGGGTVLYVNKTSQNFSTDIFDRESSGTPGVIQIVKTALTLGIKKIIGEAEIQAIESRHCVDILSFFAQQPRLSLLGSDSPHLRIPIISFNCQHKDRVFHPRFITVLLDQLFGIQMRAGCACAGPYGHRLLNIDDQVSQRYREWIVGDCEASKGKQVMGIKPGWVRFNLHYTITESEITYLKAALSFICQYADRFLPLYQFNMNSGDWVFSTDSLKPPLERILAQQETEMGRLPIGADDGVWNIQMQHAIHIAEHLAPVDDQAWDALAVFGDLAFFYGYKRG